MLPDTALSDPQMHPCSVSKARLQEHLFSHSCHSTFQDSVLLSASLNLPAKFTHLAIMILRSCEFDFWQFKNRYHVGCCCHVLRIELLPCLVFIAHLRQCGEKLCLTSTTRLNPMEKSLYNIWNGILVGRCSVNSGGWVTCSLQRLCNEECVAEDKDCQRQTVPK